MSSKTPRRLIAAITAAALSGVALAGCSTAGPEASSAEGGVLTVATNGGNALKSVLADFQAQNPGVKVEVKDYPQNYREVVGTQLAGGTAPDIIQVPPGGGNNISAKVAGGKGYYTDLAASSWAKGLPDTLRGQVSTEDNKLVAVPMTVSSIGGIYNQGALDEAGLAVPTTWTEVLGFCKSAQDAGKVAYGLGLSDTWTTQLIPYALTSTLVYGPTPDFVDQQIAGTSTFAQSKWEEALTKYQDMNEAGCFNKSPNGTPYSQVQDDIRKGATLATVSISAETAAIKATGPKDLELTYATFPATDSAAETFLPTSVGPAYGINAKTKNAELAQKFIDYLAEPTTQIGFANSFGDAAALPGDQVQDRQVDKLGRQYVADQKITTWPDRQWPSTTVQPALFDGVQGMFSGKDTPADVLAAMDTAFTSAS